MSELVRNPKQLGSVIRNARKRKGWTQMELATRTGLQQRQVSVIEAGYPSTRVQVLLALLAALELDLQVTRRATEDWTISS